MLIGGFVGQTFVVGPILSQRKLPNYDRERGATVHPKNCDPKCGVLMEVDNGIFVGGGTLCGMTERSLQFFK